MSHERFPAGGTWTTVTILAAALTFPALATEVTAQATRSIETGREYRGSVRLQSPLAGIAFALPAGYVGGWDEDVGGLVFTAGPERILGVWGWSEGEVGEVAAEVGARIESAGFGLTERGEPDIADDGFRGFFHVRTDEGRGLLYAVIRRGPQGNAAAVLALGPPETEAELVELVDEAVVASLQFSAPGAARWRSEVEGTVLASGASSSDYSSGGAASGSSASRSTTTLALCGEGRYAYESSSETYVSIAGASASSTSSDGHAGEWWLVADLAGQALLYLEADDGRVFAWDVVERGEDVLVDGTAYGVSGGC